MNNFFVKFNSTVILSILVILKEAIKWSTPQKKFIESYCFSLASTPTYTVSSDPVKPLLKILVYKSHPTLDTLHFLSCSYAIPPYFSSYIFLQPVVISSSIFNLMLNND